MKIIKRDLREKEFDRSRIENAIEMAQKDVNKNDETLAIRIADMIEDYISENQLESMTVEEIQDLVIEYLKQEDIDIAQAYKDYREQRENIRNSKMELITEINGLVDNTNMDVLMENSNKQSQLVSTQRDLIAGEVSKYISKTSLIPKHLMEAHYRGKIKIHK